MRDKTGLPLQTQPSALKVYGVSFHSKFGAEWTRTSHPKSSKTCVELVEVTEPISAGHSSPAEADSGPGSWFHYRHLRDGSTYVRYRGLFEFLVCPRGERIQYRPLDGATDQSLEAYLLGQVLSFALLARGIESIHATAVTVGDGAVAFLADSGAGKSSLAAFFLHHGHRLVTDDLLVVKNRKPHLMAQPGLPRIKLFPKVAGRFAMGQKSGVPMNNRTTKSIFTLDPGQYQGIPVPLRTIYVLRTPRKGSARAISIRRLSSRRAFMALLQGAFNIRVVQPERLKGHFAFVSEVVKKVSVKTLSYRRDLRLLPAVRKAILADLDRDGAGT